MVGVCLEYISLGIRYFKLLEIDLSLDASEGILMVWRGEVFFSLDVTEGILMGEEA